MLSVPPTVRVFVALASFDMRGSFDALAGAVRRLGMDPVNGHLYLFLNKRRRLAKAIWFVKDGKVETYDLSSIGQSMTRSWFGRLMFAPPGPDMFLVAGAWDQPYGIPNYRVSGYAAKEMAPVSSWRAPGSCANGFLHEGFLDELIHAASADPLEERLRLMIDPVSKKVLEAVPPSLISRSS